MPLTKYNHLPDKKTLKKIGIEDIFSHKYIYVHAYIVLYIYIYNLVLYIYIYI